MIFQLIMIYQRIRIMECNNWIRIYDNLSGYMDSRSEAKSGLQYKSTLLNITAVLNKIAVQYPMCCMVLKEELNWNTWSGYNSWSKLSIYQLKSICNSWPWYIFRQYIKSSWSGQITWQGKYTLNPEERATANWEWSMKWT